MSLKVISPLLIVSASTTPSTPSAGFIALYPKSDRNLYVLLSNGTEIRIN